MPVQKTPEELGWTPLEIHRLEDLGLTEEDLDEVLDYAEFVKDRGRRSGRTPT